MSENLQREIIALTFRECEGNPVWISKCNWYSLQWRCL